MSTMEGRITLQRSRFNIIADAANFDAERASHTLHHINTRLDTLDQHWIKFQEEHENLCHTLSEHSYMRERVYERCYAFYVYTRAKLLTQQDGFSSSVSSDHATAASLRPASSLMPRSALPRISLPHFSGDYQSWHSFHDLFSSIIRDNSGLTSVEKMHYLKTSLSGEAARLVTNLPVSNENFQVAWNLLVSRYENNRFLITAQLDRIYNLKSLKTKSAKGLSTLLTTISEAVGALRALGCSVHHWDPLLLHHLVRLLDTETREAWEVQLGSSSTFPTYAQFEEFLLARTRAMENLGLHTSASGKEPVAAYADKYRRGTAAHLATSPESSGTCPLCGSLHYLARCDRYQAKTPQQRREAVVKHKRCFNCLGAHAAKNCYNTRRCLRCGNKHHTSIHEALKETSSSRPSRGQHFNKENVAPATKQPSTQERTD